MSGTTGTSTAPEQRAPTTLSRSLARIDPRQVGLPMAVIALIIFFASQSEVFLTARNLQNVALQAAALALVSFGQCFVILGSGLDLSVGSTVALVSVATASVMVGFGLTAGLAAGIATGLAVGAVNAFVITRLDVVPFVATLAMLSIASGLALSLSGGTPVTGLPEGFTQLATARILGIPVPALVAAVALAGAYVFLRTTRHGRYLYAVGGNPHAARLSGIKVRQISGMTYLLSGLFSAAGALVLTARVASGQPTLGGSFALESVAAVVLGGVSLFGGRGSILGVAAGVAFVSILGNGLNLLNVSSYTQMVVLGAALIAAVAIDRRLAKRADT